MISWEMMLKNFEEKKKINKRNPANFLLFCSSSSRWIQMNIARCIAR